MDLTPRRTDDMADDELKHLYAEYEVRKAVNYREKCMSDPFIPLAPTKENIFLQAAHAEFKYRRAKRNTRYVEAQSKWWEFLRILKAGGEIEEAKKEAEYYRELNMKIISDLAEETTMAGRPNTMSPAAKRIWLAAQEIMKLDTAGLDALNVELYDWIAETPIKSRRDDKAEALGTLTLRLMDLREIVARNADIEQKMKYQLDD